MGGTVPSGTKELNWLKPTPRRPRQPSQTHFDAKLEWSLQNASRWGAGDAGVGHT